MSQREAAGAAARWRNHILAWQLDHVHPIWAKIGVDMVFDPKNNPMFFLFFLKIQDGGLW